MPLTTYPSILQLLDLGQAPIPAQQTSLPQQRDIQASQGAQAENLLDDNDAEVEIISSCSRRAPLLSFFQPPHQALGSNSVLFPDSACTGLDSPSSSVNADISSSTWHASSFSTNSGSNMCRAFSNTTSLTSNTSVDLNACEELSNSLPGSRLNSGSSITSPRIRYTKILGSPRCSSRVHTLSASSFSSLGSVAAAGLSQQNPPFPPRSAHRRRLGDDSISKIASLDAFPQSGCKPSDDEREFLSDSDYPSEGTTSVKFGRVTSHQTRVSRRKVPLAEIIGRPINASPSLASLNSNVDCFREVSELNPSPSIGSIASSFAGWPTLPKEDAVGTSSLKTMQNAPVVLSSSRNPIPDDNVEDSGCSITNTSSSLSTLRSQSCNAMPLGTSTPSAPALCSTMNSLPNATDACQQGTIEEEEEETDDDSYEFLEKEEAQGVSLQSFPRKRKRILHRGDLINFCRPGLAAIEPSSNKLIDLPLSQSQAKPRTKVMLMLGLSRSVHRRQRSNPEVQPRGIFHTEDELPSPTKKIRILESEIARLRRELEDEKTKSVQRLSMYQSLSRPNRDLDDLRDSPHVAFVARSPMAMSSPPSSSGHSHLRSPGRRSQASKRVSILSSLLSDSPVVVKKPCDGATVGGSPFIVSRVFGDGPEVVGESTPAKAEKWLQKQKVLPVAQCGARLPAIAHDLFGVKSSRSTQGYTTSEARSVQSPSAAASGWNRDRELEADLFSSPGARTTKKMNRNSKGPSAMPTIGLRNMFGNPAEVSQRRGGPVNSKRSGPGHQTPDFSIFLNELKSSGKNKLRKTPGSAKYYSLHHSSGSPKRKSGMFQEPLHRRSVDWANTSILNSVPQNFGSIAHSQPGTDTQTSRTSTTSAVTAVNVGSDSKAHESLFREEWNASSSTSVEPWKPSTSSQSMGNDTESCKSPLSQKIYPSGVNAKKTRFEDSEVQVVLGEAISTPRGSKRAGHLSRSLVDPHLTPRARALQSSPRINSPIEKDFTMDELIKQVKDMNDAVINADAEALSANQLRHHNLVHEMGFCSSIENSLELSLSSPVITGGPNRSAVSLSRTTDPHTVSQDANRMRTNPILKNLTLGRVRPQTSPSSSTSGTPNRWSGASTIRLVSILNQPPPSQDFSLSSSGILNKSVRSVRSVGTSTRRVRILEDGLHSPHRSRAGGSAAAGSRRHSMPADFQSENSTGLADSVDRDPKSAADPLSSPNASSPTVSQWVLLRSESDHMGDGEPNIKRWSLKTSAILTAHPKIV